MYEKIISQLESIIANHEKFRSSYFWRSPSRAYDRRAMEERCSYTETIAFQGKVYTYVSNVECTCNNVYYKGRFYIDDKRVTMRSFRNLLKQLQAVSSCATP